jgi:hypothetical protein
VSAPTRSATSGPGLDPPHARARDEPDPILTRQYGRNPPSLRVPNAQETMVSSPKEMSIDVYRGALGANRRQEEE